MKIQASFFSLLFTAIFPKLAQALTIETSKTSEGVETTKQSSFWLYFGENHQEIGYMTIAIGAIICLSSLIGFWRKSKQKGMVIQGEAKSIANFKINTSYEVALLMFGAFLTLFGLIVARLQVVSGCVF